MQRSLSTCVAFLLLIALVLIALPSTVHAQAAVEAGLGAGRAATTTAPAQGLGKSMGGILNGLDKTLNPAQTAAEVRTRRTAPTAATPRKKAAPRADVATYEDPKLIRAGLDYDELVRRFGPAAMELSSAGGHKTLTYSGKNGMTQVELQDGKVISELP